MNYRHTKHTQTYYTDHIRPLIEKASILFVFLLSLHNKAGRDNTHISIYQINLVSSLRTATFIPNGDQLNIF